MGVPAIMALERVVPDGEPKTASGQLAVHNPSGAGRRQGRKGLGLGRFGI